MKEFEIIASSDINPRNALEITQFVEKEGITALMSVEKPENRTINMSSIIGLLSSNIKKGDRLKVFIEFDTDTFDPKALLSLLEEER